MTTAVSPADTLALAELACRQGQFYEADLLFQEVVDGIPEPDDSSDLLLVALRGRAIALYGLGRFPAGEQQLQRILAACAKEPMGERAVDALGRLAEAVGEQERWFEAEALAREAVRRGEAALGQRHEATLSALLALAWVRSRTVPAESESWIRETREVIARALGRSHPVAWSAQHLLVATLRTLGRWDEAEQTADSLIVMRERHQGAEHPHTLRARCDLAMILHAAGKQPDATALADDVLEASRRALGPQHSFTARIRQDHATITGR